VALHEDEISNRLCMGAQHGIMVPSAKGRRSTELGLQDLECVYGLSGANLF
jgi:hypothetical protein